MPDQPMNDELSPQNEILDELKEVVDTRVVFEDPKEKEIAERITPHIKAMLKLEVRKEMEVVLTKRQDEFNESLRSATMKITQDNWEKWKADNKPLDADDVNQLLSQEYIEFPFKVQIGKQRVVRDFIIAELVEAKEVKLVKTLQKDLIPNLHKLSEVDWSSLGTQTERIQALLEVIPDFLSTMAEGVAICLDPFGEEKDIDKEWVLNNISSRRMISVIVAQAECNRYRDFLSDGFRLSKMFRTT